MSGVLLSKFAMQIYFNCGKVFGGWWSGFVHQIDIISGSNLILLLKMLRNPLVRGTERHVPICANSARFVCDGISP